MDILDWDMKEDILSSSVSVIHCDRCNKSKKFDILLNPPVGWNTYKIMGIDVILCPECGKKYEKMIIDFINNREENE